MWTPSSCSPEPSALSRLDNSTSLALDRQIVATQLHRRCGDAGALSQEPFCLLRAMPPSPGRRPVVVWAQDLDGNLDRRQGTAFSCSYVSRKTGADSVVTEGLSRSLARSLAKLGAVPTVQLTPPARTFRRVLVTSASMKRTTSSRSA